MLAQQDFTRDGQAEAAAIDDSCSLSIDYNEATGIITVTGHGVWDEPMVRHHFAKLDKLMSELRARGKPVLELVDLRDAENQSDYVSMIAASEANRVHKPQDRIAIMASSSLMKMRMKEAATRSQREFFLSENAALTWLTAYHRH